LLRLPRGTATRTSLASKKRFNVGLRYCLSASLIAIAVGAFFSQPLALLPRLFGAQPKASLQPHMARPISYNVAFLGDSTLDNVVWVHPHGGKPISSQLRDRLALALQSSRGSGYSVNVSNLACDGFTSEDMLRGGSTFISGDLRARTGDPIPSVGAGNFKPLDVLATLQPKPTHVTLSVGMVRPRWKISWHALMPAGGNDVREILSRLSNPGYLQTRIAGFHKNYPAILERVLPLGAHTVIMTQYKPCSDPSQGTRSSQLEFFPVYLFLLEQNIHTTACTPRWPRCLVQGPLW
jgi:hypothetical protein